MKNSSAVITGIVFAVSSVLALGASARAEEHAAAQLESVPAAKILPAEAGRKACWRRIYGAAHLREHPKQTLTEVMFFLRVVGYNAKGDYVSHNPDHIAYNFAISVKRRDERHPLHTGGDCLGDKNAECVVDCDGGGVVIEKPARGSGLIVRLSENGISFDETCDETRRRNFIVYPGADDKVFHLEPAPDAVCGLLEKALNPFP